MLIRANTMILKWNKDVSNRWGMWKWYDMPLPNKFYFYPVCRQAGCTNPNTNGKNKTGYQAQARKNTGNIATISYDEIPAIRSSLPDIHSDHAGLFRAHDIG